MIGSLFLMNLFIGVILVNYHLADKLSKHTFLTNDQNNWIEIQKLIYRSSPDFATYYAPKNQFRAFFLHLMKSKFFEPSIIVFIISNIICMALAHDGNWFI